MTTYNKETGSSVTIKKEQRGFDIFSDDPNIYADSEEYYCDGADAMWELLGMRCSEQGVSCNNVFYDLWGRTYYIAEVAG